MYQLYPPIFIVPEEHSFADGWEVFCCKLLNIENKTSAIARRLAPEGGVDLFDPDSKMAYQCKSIDNGLTAGFNLTLIKNSYQSALTIKDTIVWEKYVVCINTDLTGAQAENFQRELPDVTILTRSYWLSLCEKYPAIVQDNFKKIIPIPKQTLEEKISDTFYENYAAELHAQIEQDRFDLLFYSNRHHSVYRIPVSKQFKVSDLITILRRMFNLPAASTVDNGIKISLSYAIVADDKKLTLSQTIEQAGLDANSIVTFWLRITYSTDKEEASSMTMQWITIDSLRSNPVEDALDRFKALLSAKFSQAEVGFVAQG